MHTRRHFIASAASALAATSLPAAPVAKKHKLCAFTKHLQGLPFEQIADIAADVGLDGIEAPIRPGGHVEPERITEDLPKFMEALKKRNLEITIMTSGINQVSKEQHTEQVLRTAKSLGVERFRMWYYKYDLKKPIEANLAEWKPQIKDLIQLCDEIGIQPLLQNHSGPDYFGAPIWDAWSLMKDYTPKQWGFAMDAYHTTVEAGLSWPIDTSLIGDHIQAMYFKDVKWISPGKAEGVPLGTGLVPKAFATTLLKRGFQGPISLHTEYMVGKTKDADFVKHSVEAFKRDFAVMKEWIGAL